MYIRTLILTRPNSKVPFFEADSPYMKKYIADLKQAGKIVSTQTTLSEDQLVVTSVYVFRDVEVLNEWKSNPVIKAVMHLRNQYNQTAGITLVEDESETMS